LKKRKKGEKGDQYGISKGADINRKSRKRKEEGIAVNRQRRLGDRLLGPSQTITRVEPSLDQLEERGKQGVV